MADLVFKNFSYAQLAVALASGDTSVTVQDGSVFPDAPGDGEFVCVLEDVSANREIVRCTSRTSNVLQITRAQEGTTALDFIVGDQIELRYTAGSMDEYFARRGYDGGYWETASGGGSRLSWQARRNFLEPGNEPDDMYEGELALNMANDVPLLFAGPEGAVNNGVGVPIIPLIMSATEPVNKFDRLMWLDENTWLLSVWDKAGGVWRPIWAYDVTGVEYATKTELTDVQNNLYAPVGTQMLFVGESAPAGWTQDATHNDRVIRITDGVGGTVGGSWTISGMTVGATALTLAQLPAHNHGGGGDHTHTYNKTNYVQLQKPGGVDVAFLGVSGNTLETTNSSGVIISTEGSGETHTHTVSDGDGSWRPSYVNAILCIKD